MDWAREIVLKRMVIAAAITTVLDALVQFGVLTADQDKTAAGIVTLLVTLLGMAGGAFWSRSGVTPADVNLAPTASDGQPLVKIVRADPRPLGE